MNVPSFLRRPLLAVGAVSVAFLHAGCEPNAGSGAAVGAAVGAGIAALATDDGVLEGALIGAAVGAVAGHAIKARRYRDAGGAPGGSSRNYPYASSTGRAGFVKSPYSPYNVIDVRGVRSGELAIDPTTEQVFRVP
jgi:hypothetical protein